MQITRYPPIGNRGIILCLKFCGFFSFGFLAASLDFVKQALNSRKARERGVFQRSYIDRLLDAPTEHITPLNGSKLWQVAALEAWLQTHGV